MKKIKFNKKTKNIVLIVLSCIMLFGAIFGLVAIFRQDNATKEINPSYSIGALDHSTGSYVETDSAIYTKEGFECQGLHVTLEFDATIKYQLYFYSEHGDFIHTTGNLEGVFYSTGVPSYAKYARVVIVPNNDQDISFIEKFEYANQLNIKVNKKQTFKSFGDNLFVLAEDFDEGYVPSEDDGVTPIEQNERVVSSLVKVSSLKNLCLCVTDSSTGHGYSGSLYMYDKDGKFMSVFEFFNSESIFNASTGKYYYSIGLSDNVGYVRTVTRPWHNVEMYLI